MMNEMNRKRFIEIIIPYLCDGDFNDYREAISIKDCINIYELTISPQLLNLYYPNPAPKFNT